MLRFFLFIFPEFSILSYYYYLTSSNLLLLLNSSCRLGQLPQLEQLVLLTMGILEWYGGEINQERPRNNPKPAKQDEQSESSDKEEDGSDNESALYANPRGGNRICAGCERAIGNKRCFEDNGTFFHPQCLHCKACGQPLTELELELSSFGIRSFHKSCHPKCDVCNELIPYKGGLAFRTVPFWSQKYCPSHDHENIPRCCGCERLESRSAAYTSLGDGRKLCSECRESAITVTGECQQLYHAVKQFCEGMNMKFDQQIPMRLVDWQTLFETLMRNREQPVAHIRSLCMLKEYNAPIKRRTQPGKREVVAVLVLYGYPRLSLGSEIAKQMMNAWFFLKGYPNVAPSVEEGMGQVLSYLWLESSKKSKKSESEKKLGEFYMYKLANNDLPEHREAFRAAKAAVDKHGLLRSLEHIGRTGTLPK